MTNKENVLDLCKREKALSSGLIVQTEGNIVQLEIVGYIPHIKDFFAIDKIAIGYTTVRIEVENANYNNSLNRTNKQRYVYLPIAKRIVKNNEEKIIIRNDNIYLCNHQIDTDNRTNILFRKNILIKKYPELFGCDDNNFWYNKQYSEIVFEREERIVSISNNFSCLCSYISPISGKLEYALKNPSELLVSIKDIND